MAKFEKGKSGNPGGRPKVMADLQSLARVYTEKAVKELARLAAEAVSESARIAAICALLDRGYGRPAQVIDATVRHIDPDALSDAELGAYIVGNRSADNSAAEVDTTKLN